MHVVVRRAADKNLPAVRRTSLSVVYFGGLGSPLYGKNSSAARLTVKLLTPIGQTSQSARTGAIFNHERYHPLAPNEGLVSRVTTLVCYEGLVDRREAVSIAWLCDVDSAQIERMDKYVTREFQTEAPKRTVLYEEVIEANSLLSKNYREPYGLPETSPE